MYCGNSPDRLWHSNAKSRSAEKARGKPSASYLSAYDLLWWILSSFLSGESSTFGSAAKCRACAVCVGSVFVYTMGDLFICETTTLRRWPEVTAILFRKATSYGLPQP